MSLEQSKQPKIIMNFKPGKVTAEVKGIKGPACRAFSKPFMDAVGGTIHNDRPTAEMTQNATGSIQTQIQTEEH